MFEIFVHSGMVKQCWPDSYNSVCIRKIATSYAVVNVCLLMSYCCISSPVFSPSGLQRLVTCREVRLVSQRTTFESVDTASDNIFGFTDERSFPDKFRHLMQFSCSVQYKDQQLAGWLARCSADSSLIVLTLHQLDYLGSLVRYCLPFKFKLFRPVFSCSAVYCNCIVTRGGVYNKILPETEGFPEESGDISSYTPT